MFANVAGIVPVRPVLPRYSPWMCPLSHVTNCVLPLLPSSALPLLLHPHGSFLFWLQCFASDESGLLLQAS
jgi:hypothetical protein